MSPGTLLKQIFSVWKETIIDLGLWVFLLTCTTVILVSPALFLSEGDASHWTILPLTLLTAVGWVVFSQTAYGAIDEFIDTGDLAIEESFARTIDHWKPLAVGWLLYWLIGGALGSLCCIPGYLISVFALIYFPLLQIEQAGAVDGLGRSLNIVRESPGLFLVALAVSVGVTIPTAILFVFIAFAGLGGSLLAIFTLESDAAVDLMAILPLAGTVLVIAVAVPLVYVTGTTTYRALASEFDDAPRRGDDPSDTASETGEEPATPPQQNSEGESPAQ